MVVVPPTGWNPERYASNGRFVSDLAGPLLELLAVRPGERVLDLGCGDGVLSAHLVAAGARVVGVDSSPQMLAAARARGVDARNGDGTQLTFRNEFDAVFSNAALHWMTDPDAVLAGVAAALRPGGRLVAEFGGHGNVAAVRTALRAVLAAHGVDPDPVDPWYFPTPDRYRRRLSAAGFTVHHLELVSRPTTLPGPLRDWVRTFGHPWLAPLPEDDHPGVLAELEHLLGPALRDEDGRWTVDYVRLRLSATVPPR